MHWLRDTSSCEKAQTKALDVFHRYNQRAHSLLTDIIKNNHFDPTVTLEPGKRFLRHAPSFWQKKPSLILRFVLMPISWIYECSVFWRVRRKPELTAPHPVISIGNIIMGGTGKTPFVLKLAQHLEEKGMHPICVTRGYGGTLKGPLWVTLQHKAHEVGDETMLLARSFPTLLSRKRSDIAYFDTYPPKTVFLLDDGHQHTSLKKDLSILILDAGMPKGNKYLFPLGPLRESLSNAARRSHFFVTLSEKHSKSANSHLASFGLPVIQGMRKTHVPLPKRTKIIAFAALGNPKQFYNSLKASGYDLFHFYAFPDHMTYSDQTIQELHQKAVLHHAQLVTTEKDFVKISPRMQPYVTCAKLHLEFQDSFENLLCTICSL